MAIDISEKVNTQKQLEYSDNRLKSAQQIAQIGYWEYDLITKDIFWTDEMYYIYQRKKKEGPLFSNDFKKKLHEKDRARFQSTVEKVIASRQPNTIEFKVHRKENDLRFLKTNMIPVYNEQNELVKLKGTVQDITDAKSNEGQLRLYNERFNIIAQITNDAIFDWNITADTTWWSDSQFRLFGFESTRSIPSFKKWMSKIYHQDRHLVHELLHGIKSGHINSFSRELRYYISGNKIGNLIVKAYVIREDAQIRILGGFIENTNRKKGEEAIKKSNERYELISRATNDAVWDWELSTNLISGNNNLYKLYGYDRSTTTLSDEIFFSRIHPDDLERVRTKMGEALFDRKETIVDEYRFLYPDNKYKEILSRSQVIYDEAGLPARILGAMQDITLQRQSQKTMMEINNRLVLATISANLGIFDWDIYQDKMVWNEYMYEMFDMDPTKFDHKFGTWLHCVHPRDVSKFDLFKYSDNSKSHHFHETIRIFSLQEEIRHIEIYALIIKDKTENTKSIVGVCKDISETVNTEKQIARAIINTQEEERYETGQELHDNVVQVLVACLMNLNLADEHDQGLNNYLKTGIDHIKDAINEIRRLSHQLAPSNLGSISLEEMIKKLLSDMNSNDLLRISFEADLDQPDKIPSDLKLNIYRIVQEQVHNVLKHSKADAIVLTIESGKHLLRVRIRDNGVGFNPQKTSFGIGLNNIKRRARVFEGEITINSSPNQGCELIVEIPIP